MTHHFEFDLNAALDRIAARRGGRGDGPKAVAPSIAGAPHQLREPVTARGQADGSTVRCERSAETPRSQLSQMSHVAASGPAMSLDLTDDEREAFEERAAIAEFDGGLTRVEAERLAFACIVAGR